MIILSSRQDKLRRGLVTAVPYVWFLLLLFVPFLFVLKISLATPELASPPYSPLITFAADHTVNITLKLGNYVFLLSHSAFAMAFLQSIKLALLTTALCILIGYPMAYAIAVSNPRRRNFLFAMVILPYWTSFLLRTYAWINILQNNGIINSFLMKLHLIDTPIHMLYTNFSVALGLLYGYLPFFILPLYATLIKLDKTLLEAAADLGCRPWKAFLTITLPLSLPGVFAGALLVFIPAVGEVVIPQILGGLNTLMIGNVIWQEFFVANNWCVAAALSVIMLVLLVIPVVMLQRIQSKRESV
jgi:putrescine transport system permease protein